MGGNVNLSHSLAAPRCAALQEWTPPWLHKWSPPFKAEHNLRRKFSICGLLWICVLLQKGPKKVKQKQAQLLLLCLQYKLEMRLPWKICRKLGIGKPIINAERASSVSCDGIMASSFLEMNDTWNIHNTNIWHFSSFMNPDLEMLSCFLGRLPFWYGVCHACSKAWPDAFPRKPGFSHLHCYEAFWLQTWARFSYTDPQDTRGQMS